MELFDFDRQPDRSGTGSTKWGRYAGACESHDVIPMWVADMDFGPAPCVEAALARAVPGGVYGYTDITDEYLAAVVGFMARRHAWDVSPDAIVFQNGVVPALSVAVRAFTAPGDRVLLLPPLYPPFTRMVEQNGREAVYSPMQPDDAGLYRMNFDDMEQKAADPRVKMLLFCSPHNPTGRVFTEDELRKVADICKRHDVIIVSDEIHFDLSHAGDHMVFHKAAGDMADRCAILTAPSKTFNVAGLQLANIIIPGSELRARYKAVQAADGYDCPSFFGYQAMLAAYTQGDAWLDAMLAYIRGNFDLLQKSIAEQMPRLSLTPPQALYLAWVDCRALSMSSNALRDYLIKEAGVAVSSGSDFGEGGEGFLRMNLALPRCRLETALSRMAAAIEALCRNKA